MCTTRPTTSLPRSHHTGQGRTEFYSFLEHSFLQDLLGLDTIGACHTPILTSFITSIWSSLKKTISRVFLLSSDNECYLVFTPAGTRCKSSQQSLRVNLHSSCSENMKSRKRIFRSDELYLCSRLIPVKSCQYWAMIDPQLISRDSQWVGQWIGQHLLNWGTLQGTILEDDLLSSYLQFIMNTDWW